MSGPKRQWITGGRLALGVVLLVAIPIVALLVRSWLADPERAPDIRTDLTGMVFVHGGVFTANGRKFDLEPYWIDRFEVTESDWQRYADATGRDMPDMFGEDEPRGEDFPMRYVSFDDAMAYARWQFKNVPTNLQWERACQGPRGQSLPWGEGYFPAANTFEAWDDGHLKEWRVTRVGIFERGRSGVGAYDMIGNVWEWTSSGLEDDLHDVPVPQEVEDRLDLDANEGDEPSDDWSKRYRLVRGGSFRRRIRGVNPQLATLERAEVKSSEIGFRCVIAEAVVAVQREVQSWLNELGWSDPINARLRARPAVQSLVEMGAPARPYLEVAREHAGPIVRGRIDEILGRPGVSP